MNRRRLTGVLVLVAVILAAVAVWFRYASASPPNGLALAGDVESDVWTVQAPAILYPAPDYSVGIPTSQTAAPATATAGIKKGGSPAPSQVPTVSGQIQRMYVTQGDHVSAGQIVAQYDTTRLKLGVEQAKAAASRAHAQVVVLANKLDTVISNQDKLATAREQLDAAKAAFPALKAKALQTRAALVAQRAALEAQLAQILKSPKPDPKAVGALKAIIAKLSVAIATLDKGLAAAATGFATADAQIAQGASDLAKAKSQLERFKDVASATTAIQDAGVTLAEVRVAQATIRAPVSGTVTEARNSGTVAMVGAPLVRIRADGPTKVDAYLAPDQLTQVKVGSKASIAYDSNTRGPLTGRVTWIATRAEFPPTSYPTNIVHMTRTTRVTVTLDNGGWAPPGTPVDLVISTRDTR